VFSQAVGADSLRIFAAMTGIEFLLIGRDTKIEEFRNELRWNELAFALRT